MEKILTITVSLFVYSWIYGEKLYYFLKGENQWSSARGAVK